MPTILYYFAAIILFYCLPIALKDVFYCTWIALFYCNIIALFWLDISSNIFLILFPFGPMIFWASLNYGGDGR